MRKLMGAAWMAGVLGAGFAGVASGCGGDDGDKDTTEVTAETTTETVSEVASETTGDTGAETTPSACLATPPASVAGSWAMLEVQTALVTVDPFGTMTQVSTNIYQVDIAGANDALTVTAKLCSFETKDDAALFTTVMGDQLLAHLTPFVRTGTLAAEGGEAKFRVAQGVTLRGLNFTEPATEAMPTDGTDARIVDQDEDTHPGITLTVSGTLQGQLYTTHRHKAALDGCFESDSRATGLTAWTTEQTIVGANPTALSATKPVASTHPDPKKSHFTLVKVPAGTDCAAIKAQKSTLFAEE